MGYLNVVLDVSAILSGWASALRGQLPLDVCDTFISHCLIISIQLYQICSDCVEIDAPAVFNLFLKQQTPIS